MTNRLVTANFMSSRILFILLATVKDEGMYQLMCRIRKHLKRINAPEIVA